MTINFKNIYLRHYLQSSWQSCILRFLLLRNLRFVLSLFQSQKLCFEFSRLWWNFRYCQVRPVVSVHHFSPCEHGQEAGCDHFHVSGPGHARGHGRWARWGAKSVVLKGSRLTTKGNKRHRSGKAESEHLGFLPPQRPSVLVYDARTRRGRTSFQA